MRKSTIQSLSMAILGIFAASITNSNAEKPNIVLIFLDDLGYADVDWNAELFGVELPLR